MSLVVDGKGGDAHMTVEVNNAVPLVEDLHNLIQGGGCPSV